ncbi:MAG: hypothetical protein IT432_15930 [Phycisphaerales bacterium]|nr:hypothetical protein [Phycisphaerales bacterium]
MHPEQAPGPDRSPERPEHAPARAPDEHDLRQNPDAADGDEPRDADEHAAADNSPIDHSMLDALDATADPARELPAPDGESARDDKTPPASSVEQAAPALQTASAAADAATPPAAGLAAGDSTAPTKPRRKRRERTPYDDCRLQPPFPLTLLAQKLWNRLYVDTPHMWLIASNLKAARYCTLFAMWIEISQVLGTKGMIYVRHAKDNARVDAIRIMPHFQYLVRLEYVLESLERDLGIDARGDAAEYEELRLRCQREDAERAG